MIRRMLTLDKKHRERRWLQWRKPQIEMVTAQKFVQTDRVAYPLRSIWLRVEFRVPLIPFPLLSDGIYLALPPLPLYSILTEGADHQKYCGEPRNPAETKEFVRSGEGELPCGGMSQEKVPMLCHESWVDPLARNLSA